MAKRQHVVGLVGFALLGLLSGGPAAAQFLSHVDLAPLPKLEEAECPKTDAEKLARDAPHHIEGLIGGATLSYVQAVNNLGALLEASVSSKAIDALKADPRSRDPLAAEALAAGALARQQPMAALALLLQAHELDRGDPLHLINLAGLSNYLGFHREALALLAEAETKKGLDARVGGMNVRSVLLSNRGYALNATGRPKEAEAALQQAIKLDPNLAEAYTNIAYALGDQDKCLLAVRYLRAGKTRRPAKVIKEKKPGPRLPPAEVVDLSRGRAGQLPAMHLATSPEEGDDAGLKQRLAAVYEQSVRDAETALQRQMRFTEQSRARRLAWAERGPVGALSAERAEWLLDLSREYAEEVSILMQLAGTPDQTGGRYRLVLAEVPDEAPQHPDPELQPKVEAVLHERLEMLAHRLEATVRFTEQRTAIYKTWSEEDRRCNGNNLCQAGAALRRDTAICNAGKEAASRRMASMKAFNAAYRDIYAESSRRLSAVAAYFGDAAHHGEAQERIRFFAHQSAAALAGQVAAHQQAQANGAEACRAANKRMVDLVIDHLKTLEANRCEGGRGAKVGVGVLEVGAECEEVSVTASTPGWLGLFAKVSYEQSKRYEYVKAGKERFLAQQAGLDPNIRLHVPDYDAAFDGKLTIYAGGKAGHELGGAGADVKAGGYVELNGKGEITGYGAQSETSVSGTVGGVGAEATVAKKRLVFSPGRSGD